MDGGGGGREVAVITVEVQKLILKNHKTQIKNRNITIIEFSNNSKIYQTGRRGVRVDGGGGEESAVLVKLRWCL